MDSLNYSLNTTLLEKVPI